VPRQLARPPASLAAHAAQLVSDQPPIVYRWELRIIVITIVKILRCQNVDQARGITMERNNGSN
jgi:hypothetical protein